MVTTPIPDAFDLEAIHDQQIAPLMAQILEICKANHLPMFAAFACRSDGVGTVDYSVSVVQCGDVRHIDNFSKYCRDMDIPKQEAAA